MRYVVEGNEYRVSFIFSIITEYQCYHATIERLCLQLEKGRIGKTVYQVRRVDIIKNNQQQHDGWESLVAYRKKMFGVECVLRYHKVPLSAWGVQMRNDCFRQTLIAMVCLIEHLLVALSLLSTACVISQAEKSSHGQLLQSDWTFSAAVPQTAMISHQDETQCNWSFRLNYCY